MASVFVVTLDSGEKVTVVPPGASSAALNVPPLDVKGAVPPLDVKSAALDVKTAAFDIKSATPRPEELEFTCPHCGEVGVVGRNELNCQIFRHAEYRRRRFATGKSSPQERLEIDEYNKTVDDHLAGSFVNPHLSKEACEALIASGKIDGCGKPFTFDGVTAKACGYI